MIFDWMSDPTAWLGLATLVILEIVLGIDNLVFIAILADKLPPHQRNRARMIGLTLAMVMRLGLLASIAWVVTLTQPLFTVLGAEISGRDLILILGGLFRCSRAPWNCTSAWKAAPATTPGRRRSMPCSGR